MQDGDVYAVQMSSMPPDSRSYYDSLGSSVLFAVRHDLGMVTYVASDLRNVDTAWHRAVRAAVAL